MPNFLGLDIGTTSIKAILLDTDKGRIISSSSLPTPVEHSSTGMDEHDPCLLFDTAARCIQMAVSHNQVHALGISSFAEAGLPLDRSGSPLFPIIAWYDKRSQQQAEAILEFFSPIHLFQITGQKTGFSFGLFKYMWIKEKYPDSVKDMEFWLSVPDYILYRLTGKMATDYTQASRTMLFDQRKKNWSDELLQYAQIAPNNLPTLLPSGSVMGSITREASEITGLPAGTPCVTGGHDHLCGAYASGGIQSGNFIDSSGTACAVMALTSEFNDSRDISLSGYVNYIHVVPDTYVIKGGLKAAGKAVEWLASRLNRDDLFSGDALTERYRSSHIPRPLWLPFFLGSGTPAMEPYNRASLVGVTLDHSSEDIAIALLESLGFWLRNNLEAMQKITGLIPEKIISIGGTNQSKLVRQIKANISNLPVETPSVPQSSAIGAALLAAVGTGIAESYHKAPLLLDYPFITIYPDTNLVTHYNSTYENVYLPAINRLKDITVCMQRTNK